MTLTFALLEGSGLFAAAFVAIGLWGPPPAEDWVGAATVLGQALALSLCYVIAFYLNDLYDLRSVRSFSDYAPRLVQAVGIAFILVALADAFLPHVRLRERPFVLSVLIVVGFVVTFRAVSYDLMRRRPFAERVLVLGWTPLAGRLIEEMAALPHRHVIIGVAEDATDGGEMPPRYPILGPLARLDKIIDEVHPDRVIVALANRRGRMPVNQLLAARVEGVIVEDGLDAYERLTGKVAIESLTPGALIFSRDFRKSRLDLAVGRGLSLLVSLSGLVALSPLCVLIAIAIKADSRGPVFFRHERAGLHGRAFKLIKFRTMHPTERPPSEWARDNGARITRVGQWLRKFRLDEVPQFVNILRGEMNLVGPRPHPVSNVELFTEHIPYYFLRHRVRPGVTGWAQVRYGYANDLSEETEKMRYDLYYIKRLSPWLDVRIMFETARIMLFGRGDGR